MKSSVVAKGYPLKLILWLSLLLSACVTPVPSKYGVQPDQLAHIPARIAVLSCRLWPQGALFVGQPESKGPEGDITGLCEAFDKYVLQGFDDQPYMRGISPAVTRQLLQKSGQTALLDQIEQLWYRPSQVCQACQTALAYYKEVVATRIDWRQWLNNLSRASANSDAILMPFISDVQAGVIDDRGLFYARRSTSIVLLLIDTNNGELIWAGRQEAEARSLLPEKPKDEKEVSLPPWDEVYKRLFVPELWTEFPGRQS